MLSNRRGSIPVTLLVILTVSLFAFSIFAFVYASVIIKKGVDEGYSNVAEFNVGLRNRDFLVDRGFIEYRYAGYVRELAEPLLFGKSYEKIRINDLGGASSP